MVHQWRDGEEELSAAVRPRGKGELNNDSNWGTTINDDDKRLLENLAKIVEEREKQIEYANQLEKAMAIFRYLKLKKY